MSELKPVYLYAGGPSRDSRNMVASISNVLKENCRSGPAVAYLGAANGDNLMFYEAMKAMLHAAGASDVPMVRLAKPKADIEAAKRSLEKADAIFISGGEVEDGMRWLVRHELTGFLSELRGSGKLFLGVSAGSIMMGTSWVKWTTPKDNTTAELFDCLGFARTIFDTHAEDEDWIELKTALRLGGPGTRGYGIPSGGMVYIDSSGRMTAPGKPLLSFMNVEGEVRQIG